jgi:hypothetical protein
MLSARRAAKKTPAYHITTIYFRGNINYDFYGVGTDSGNAGLKSHNEPAGPPLTL